LRRKTFAVRGQHATGTIKAGRRKLSRKKNGKAQPFSGKVRFTFQTVSMKEVPGSGMSLKTRHFFTAHFALQRLAEI